MVILKHLSNKHAKMKLEHYSITLIRITNEIEINNNNINKTAKNVLNSLNVSPISGRMNTARPVKKLKLATERLIDGDFETPIKQTRKDEIGTLQ
jgi:hypothetical protein